MHQRRSLFPLISTLLLLTLVGLLALGRSPILRAQETEANPPAATTLDSRALLTLDLEAGFALDPFFVSVNGGGSIDAATLNEACSGMVSEAPVLTLNWSGEADLARVFFHSDHDSSIVVQGPDGNYTCGANAAPLLFDGSVQFDNPAPGQYSIWVGYEGGQGLIPGVLVVTTRPDVNVANFELGSLIQRPAMPALAAGDAESRVGEGAVNEYVGLLPEASEVRSALASFQTLRSFAPLTEGTTLTATTALTGVLPGFLLPVNPASPQPLCSGIGQAKPALTFTVADGLPALRIFVESEADTTLALITPDGDALCTDESADGVNRNPLLDVENPAPGTWAVLVGRLGADDVADAQVTATTDLTLEPALLEAAPVTVE